MRAIDRHELQDLAQQGAQVVEVLPREEYEEEHLPGALSMPLRLLTAETAGHLDKGRPVIVYCWDSACDLSPRAAWRLESLGFSPVYDYAAGKADWLAAGLPSEGRNAKAPRAGKLAHPIATASLDDRVATVRARFGQHGVVAIVNQQCVVLGLIDDHLASHADPDARAETVMRNGPPTFRPDVPAGQLAEHLAERHASRAIITTNDGVLVGVAYRSDLEGAVASSQGEVTDDLATVIAEFEAQGYTGQFIAKEGGRLRCVGCGHEIDAAQVKLMDLRRVEGTSDPADMAAVAALECPICGMKGTVTLKYGPEATLEEEEVLKRLEDHRPS